MSAPTSPRRNRRLVILGLITLGCLVFIGANAHLFYVAFSSQPDCVDHLKAPGEGPGTYRAAQSDC